MPPKKRARRNHTPSDLVEETPHGAHGADHGTNNATEVTPTEGTITLDVRALTATISVAVAQAVQQALAADKASTSTAPCDAPPAASQERAVETAIQDEMAVITTGTRSTLDTITTDAVEPQMPIFSSVAMSLGSFVSAKIKGKIWANEFIDFGALLYPVHKQERYSLSLAPHDQQGSTTQPQLTLEPSHASKRITSITQWLSAFNTFVAIYTSKFHSEAPKLMKYCEIVRDITNKPGDWNFYDQQFRFLRQSVPDQHPWDGVHWELWLKAVTSFRHKSQATFSDKPTFRHKGRQQFSKGVCWVFNAGKYCAAGCRFEHKCSHCGSKHPASQCSGETQQRVFPQRNKPASPAASFKEPTSNPRKGGSS